VAHGRRSSRPPGPEDPAARPAPSASDRTDPAIVTSHAATLSPAQNPDQTLRPVKPGRTSSQPRLDSEQTAQIKAASHVVAYGEVVDALPMPAAVLNTAGLVVACNPGLAERLERPRGEVVGEPLLLWIGRASERSAFGRAFLGLRQRPVHHSFSLELGSLQGPPVLVRACKLAAEHVLVTCDPVSGERAHETEIGSALARGLEALDHGLLLLDGHGVVVHANPAARDLFGAGAHSDLSSGTAGLIARSLLERADPDGARALSQALTVARAGNWRGELELRRLDGEPIPVELSLAAGRGEGAPTVALIRDLRERRLREFEDRLAAQVDRLLVSSVRPQESVPAACNAVMTGLGFARATLLARVGDTWQRWSMRPDLAPRITPLTHAGTGPLVPPSAWSAGDTVVDLDPADPQLRVLLGEPDPTRAAVRVTLGGGSRIVGHLVLFAHEPGPVDPHTRRLLATLAPQLALGLANGLLMLETEALAAYQAMVLDQTTVLLNTLDADGRVVTWNRASEQLLGLSAAEARGRRFGVDVAVLHGADWHDLWGILRRTGSFTGEVNVVAPDAHARADAVIPLHLEGRLLRDRSADARPGAGPHPGSEGPGRVVGAVLVALDLRRRRALEDQIQRAQKLAAVGLLAAGIAHEINNPLSGVVGYSRLLLERPLAPDLRDKVEKIAASGERCRKIVEGVLLFSRQREGGQRRPVELRGILDRVLRIGEYQWRMHNVRVVQEGLPSATIFADADQIEQVLLNLLSNAVDAMPRGGTIRINLAHAEADDGPEAEGPSARPGPDSKPGRVRLEVADEGVGIPPEVQGRIFDPFFSTKEIGKGTGLGLAISYGIVKDHGGDILVRSKPGQGTTFIILLPAPTP
jgi:signal transduction histidine kinase